MLDEYFQSFSQLESVIKRPGFQYGSCESFVAANGRSFIATPLHKDFKFGTQKECFKNAFNLANEHEDILVYCEGYAHSIIPTLHAWCVDKDGIVYDNTWRDGGEEYFGIPFDLNFVRKFIIKRKKYGVIDSWDIGFPMLKGDIPRSEFYYKGTIK